MALNAADNQGVVELFTHQLRIHQYRTFTNGNVIVTVWLDEDLVFTASSEFDTTPTIRSFLRGTDTSTPKERLSFESIKVLEERFSVEELKNLATVMGLPTGI
jgi:hypothetical protein